MALVSTIIETGFAAMIATKPKDSQDACNKIGAFYQSYAAGAQAGVAVPTFTGLEEQRFVNILYATLKNPAGSAASAAAAFVAAMTSFWMSPPVVFGAGAVTAFPGAAALEAALITLWSHPNDSDAASSGLATALDTATKTITVVIGPSTFTLT